MLEGKVTLVGRGSWLLAICATPVAKQCGEEAGARDVGLVDPTTFVRRHGELWWWVGEMGCGEIKGTGRGGKKDWRGSATRHEHEWLRRTTEPALPGTRARPGNVRTTN